MGDFCDVPDAAALLAAGESWGYPIMLKARTLAYDGRGNLPVKAAKDVPAAFAELSRGGAMGLYAERWCSFTVELAVMVARSSDGTTATCARRRAQSPEPRAPSPEPGAPSPERQHPRTRTKC